MLWYRYQVTRTHLDTADAVGKCLSGLEAPSHSMGHILPGADVKSFAEQNAASITVNTDLTSETFHSHRVIISFLKASDEIKKNNNAFAERKLQPTGGKNTRAV